MSSRTRSRSDLRPVCLPGELDYSSYPASCTNKSWVQNYVQSAKNAYNGTYEEMTDFVTPDFHNRVKKGEVIFSPCSRKKITNSCVPGSGGSAETTSYTCTNPNDVSKQRVDHQYIVAHQTRGILGVPHYVAIEPVSSVSASDIDAACKEVFTSVQASRGAGPANLYEDIAQYKQTLATAEDALKSAKKVISRIPLQRLKGASSAYLLYRYGLRPLISDLMGVYDAIGVEEKLIRYATRDKILLTGRNVTQNAGTYSWTTVTAPMIRVDEESTQIRAMSLDEYQLTKAYAAGFSLKNLETVAWDLIPLSFVADWFINFGDFLKASAPTPYIKQLGSCVVVKRDITSSWFPGTSSAISGWKVTGSIQGRLDSHGSYYNRVNGSAMTTGVVIKSDFRFDHIARSLDAISLITQRIPSSGKLGKWRF